MKMISIIIPVYNKEKFIKNTLDSVIKQTIKNYEIIIVNDGSTDNSLSIIEEYFKKNNNTKYSIITQCNKGVSEARNIGIEEANGEYIFFLDGDDEIKENSLEILSKNIKCTNSDFSVCGYNVYENDKVVNTNKFLATQQYKSYDFLKLFIKSKVNIYMGNALYKKSIIKNNNIKFDTKYNYNEDQIFIYKYLIRCKNVFFDERKLFIYTRGESSVTTRVSNERVSNINIFIDFIEFMNKSDIENKKSIIELINNYKIPYGILTAARDLIRWGSSEKNFIDIINKNKRLIKKLKNYKFNFGKKTYLRIKLFQYCPRLFFKFESATFRRRK